MLITTLDSWFDPKVTRSLLRKLPKQLILSFSETYIENKKIFTFKNWVPPTSWKFADCLLHQEKSPSPRRPSTNFLFLLPKFHSLPPLNNSFHVYSPIKTSFLGVVLDPVPILNWLMFSIYRMLFLSLINHSSSDSYNLIKKSPEQNFHSLSIGGDAPCCVYICITNLLFNWLSSISPLCHIVLWFTYDLLNMWFTQYT